MKCLKESYEQVMNQNFADISKTKFEGLFWSNVDIGSSNIKHWFKNVFSVNPINVKIIRKKNMDNGNGISKQSQLKNSKR